jgi:dsRNA-specific ribonuclease
MGIVKKIDTIPKKNLAELFQLLNQSEIFHQALQPKSLGGSNSFKLLAIYGDNILNISLLDLITKDDSTDTGVLTESLQSFHNSTTLTKLATYLKIDEIMRESWGIPNIPNKDLKEAIEALLGATYLKVGFKNCQKVVQQLVSISTTNNFLNPNPIGVLNLLFQKRGLNLPKYTTIRVGGPDHQAKFICKLEGEYEEKFYTINSSIDDSKKKAEKNAAAKFLEAIEEEKRLNYFLLSDLKS